MKAKQKELLKGQCLMVNNFGGFNGGFNQLPNQNSFQRRSNFNGNNNVPSKLNNNVNNHMSSNLNRKMPSNANNSSFQNRYSADGKSIKSLDGREWETRDQAMVANKEYYKKLGRDINHTKENPEAFNLTNFYKFNKD